MNGKKSILKQFISDLGVIFIPSILGITIAGMLVGNPEAMYGGLLGLAGGLAFESILQIFFWSCVLSALSVVLTSDIWFVKIRLLWRVIVMLLLSIAATALFAFVFHWFPTDLWEAWAGFLISFSLTFGTGLFIMVAKTKIEDKRYNKLLTDYKSKKEEEK